MDELKVGLWCIVRGEWLLGSNSCCYCHLQITVTEALAICKCTNFNVWAVTLVPLSTWNAFPASKGFREARWWTVPGIGLWVLATAFMYLESRGERALFISFAPRPYPIEWNCFSDGIHLSFPAMLETWLSLKMVRVLVKVDPSVGHIPGTCVKEFWFLIGKGKKWPYQWKVVKEVL